MNETKDGGVDVEPATVEAKEGTKEDVAMSSGVGAGDWSSGRGLLLGRETLGPLLLMTTMPCFSIVFFHVCANMDGDFVSFLRLCWEMANPARTIHSIWPDPWDPVAWKMIGTFLGLELILMRIVPGRQFEATVTPTGHVPVYRANGTACYVLTLAILLVSSHFGVFRPALVYDKFGEILSAMNVFALMFCVFLLTKGHVAPSSTDCGTNNNWIIDFYWGMELYPRVFLEISS